MTNKGLLEQIKEANSLPINHTLFSLSDIENYYMQAYTEVISKKVILKGTLKRSTVALEAKIIIAKNRRTRHKAKSPNKNHKQYLGNTRHPHKLGYHSNYWKEHASK